MLTTPPPVARDVAPLESSVLTDVSPVTSNVPAIVVLPVVSATINLFVSTVIPPLAASVPVKETVPKAWSLSILNVFPVLEIPVPALREPAPLNCENAIAVVPTVIEPSVVNTKPASALVLPDSTKVNRHDVTSTFTSFSVEIEMMTEISPQSEEYAFEIGHKSDYYYHCNW